MRGVARLISSTRTSCANTGPGLNSNVDAPPAAVDVDLSSRDVGRHQVGRALHACPLQAQRGGQRLGEMGLAETGQSLDQDMARREDRRDEVADELLLADDDALEQRAQLEQLTVGIGEGVVASGSGVHRLRPVAFIHACT